MQTSPDNGQSRPPAALARPRAGAAPGTSPVEQILYEVKKTIVGQDELLERMLVALLSRYHRKSGPRKKHEEFAALSDEDQALVRRLSALLRVADGLDRGHTGLVESLRVHVNDDRVLLQAVPRTAGADLSLECWGATRKSDVLEKELDRSVVIEAL